ncbi:NUMOD4 domain-containing protein [Tepidibacter formicigenes]|uniref:NUMOD4 motif-containing protein n=1 Tax=Tepidibacter formicigenes DSM 15518 TaxID=1123349 RepID=A0A1M6LV68_9FIRM|nr:NUMOD4 domain-containing protein [Tepidibacter formicigenes]SHJ75076.1 NUMOD4 motif-containing protein [Tepidibacter formicigenes DSM 15518]
MRKIPEYWLDVPGSKKYQVSNYGNFRRKLKNGKVKPIKSYLKKNKWMVVKVDFNGTYREYEVHKIVADVFLEKRTSTNMVLYHKNGIKGESVLLGWRVLLDRQHLL